MIEFFKSSDFSCDPNSYTGMWDGAAKVANEKLNAALGPKVYGADPKTTSWSTYPVTPTYDMNSILKDFPYQAHLFGIQEIKREPCVHEPEKTRLEFGGVPTAVCRFCNVPLLATWSEKK